MASVAFYTLGCKVNQYESAGLAAILRAAGFSIVQPEDKADFYVVNSCSVTSLADRKSRQYIRRMKRQNPNSKLIVMGCYSEISPETLKAMPEVDYVLGTQNKKDVLKIISGQQLTASPDITANNLDNSRTRAYIQIQDGCNRFCSYCVIPYARHVLWSKPVAEIVSEAKALLAAGFKELVLTGINTALYEGGVEPVIKALNEIPGDFRIRLGSLEPTVINAEYVKKLFAYDKLCHHLHLSVQSGSDNVIKAMHRHYTSAEYIDIVNTVRSFDPLYGITTDIIAGFPGESEEDFAGSLAIIEKSEYLKVHAFPYSARPFTKAASMEGQISPEMQRKRNKKLIELGDIVSEKFRAKMLGSSQKVLVEEKVGSYWKGHADNFCPVYIKSDSNLAGKYVNVICEVLYKDGIKAKEI